MNRLFKRIGAGVLCGLLLMANTAYGETRIDGGLVETFKRIAVQASATLSSAGWVGLGAAKARLVFTDAAVDLAEFTGGVFKIGTVHYIGSSSLDLDAYIATSAVTAGDTLRLCHSGMTITDDIDVTKGINIVGQGIGKTTITCATASKKIFDIPNSSLSVRISDMSITSSGTGATSCIISALGTNYGTLTLKNLDITSTGGTDSYGVYAGDITLIAEDVNITHTGTDTASSCMGLRHIISGAGAVTGSLKNVTVNGTVTRAGTVTNSVYLAATIGTNTVSIQDCYFLGTNPNAGTGLAALRNVGATVSVRGSTLNGEFDTATGADVLNTSGTLTLYDTTLVNGTTSGTITYGGTVVSGGLILDPGGVLNAKIGHTSANFYVGANTDGGRMAVVDNVDPCLSAECFSTTDTNSGFLSFIKSASGTKGTLARTETGETLGQIWFHGCTAVPGLGVGAKIKGVQNGVTGTYVPIDLVFETASAEVATTERMRIDSAGRCNHVNAVSYTPDAITATSEGVAASLNTVNTEVTTNGDADLDNVTLADGLADGQIKHIYCTVETNAGDTWKITPTELAGGTQITFAGVGTGCTLVYDSTTTKWIVVANNGGTIA